MNFFQAVCYLLACCCVERVFGGRLCLTSLAGLSLRAPGVVYATNVRGNWPRYLKNCEMRDSS